MVRKRFLTVLGLYYIAVVLVFQIFMWLSGMRAGRPAFGGDEMPLAFTSAIIPVAPLVWLAARLLDCWSVVRREP